MTDFEQSVNKDTEYSCTMKFSSKGDGPGVTLNYEFSHLFAEDYAGDLPASFLAMRDTAIMLTHAISVVDNMAEDSSPDDKAQAILELGDGLTENNTKH